MTDNQSRTATGTADPWGPVGSRACDVSTERDKGSPYYASGSSWSPSASTQTSNFTQTRIGVQPREYQCYNTERNAVTNQTRRVNVQWENAPNDSHTFSRTVTVTRVGPYDYGSLSCPSYGTCPSSGTRYRTCTQPRRYEYRYVADGSRIYTRYANTDSRNVTQSQSCTPSTPATWQITGGDDCNVTQSASQATSWYNNYISGNYEGYAGPSCSTCAPITRGATCSSVGSTATNGYARRNGYYSSCPVVINFKCQR